MEGEVGVTPIEQHAKAIVWRVPQWQLDVSADVASHMVVANQ